MKAKAVSEVHSIRRCHGVGYSTVGRGSVDTAVTTGTAGADAPVAGLDPRKVAMGSRPPKPRAGACRTSLPRVSR